MHLNTEFYLPNKPKPKQNKFAFKVTETYTINDKTIYPTYKVDIPSKYVKFMKYNDGYKMSIQQNEILSNLQEKENKLGIEIMLYPEL